MTNVSALLGIRPAALPAWLALCAVLDRLADDGRSPVCVQRPGQWSSDAKPADRQDAAEACTFCPALALCAAYADAADERHGVWGGIDRTARPVTRRQETAA
jgi:hypothetical protein